ncbi:putative adhesin [Microbulbifer sp. ANSA003]|uniref:putative adhesin n=1 Tax=unclassified Microbulbifer TaxID=2619833 RepID=UPI00403A097C
MPVREFDLVKIFAPEGTNVGDAPSLVISAHGAATKQVFYNKGHGGDNLLFFAPHGYTLEDPGLQDVVDGKAKVHEHIGKGKICRNYMLKKFQGYHGSTAGQIFGRLSRRFINDGESYAQIQNVVDEAHNHNVKAIRNQARLQQYDLNDPFQKSLYDAKVGASLYTTKMEANFLTIRNRHNQKSPTLADVLNILHRNNLHYENIYCSFCRNELSVGNLILGTPSWDSKKRKVNT